VLFTQVSGGFLIHFITDDICVDKGFQMSFQRFDKNHQNDHFRLCPNVLLMAKTNPQPLPYLSEYMPSDSSCVFEINSEASIEFDVKYVSSNVKIAIYDNKTISLVNSTKITL
jgi:hypothetical protein